MNKLKKVKEVLEHMIWEFDCESLGHKPFNNNRTDVGAKAIIEEGKAALAELNEVMQMNFLESLFIFKRFFYVIIYQQIMQL